ncbi:hypothetical protein D3C87_1706850 [compost metagenome]
MLLGGRFDSANDGLFVADIGHRPFGLATGIADGRGHRLQRFLVTPAQHNRRALFGETLGGGGTDA